jgi:hypothetical protein
MTGEAMEPREQLQIVIVGAVMWPIALPQTKVVHLLRLSWATVVASVNQYKSRQGHATIKSQRLLSISVAYPKRIQSEYVKGMEKNRLRYQAYRLRIGCVSKANISKGWKRLNSGIKRIGCVSAAYPKQIHQKDGNDSTAVSSVSAAYQLRIHGA